MFSLKQQVKLSHVNVRNEMHGEDHVTATDIKIEVKVSNDLLAEFHSDLKHFLYLKDDSPDQSELPLDANRATKLRLPLMGPLKWGWEGAGYHLTVEHGINEASYIKLGDCEVDHIVLHPQEGGTVAIVFRVIAHPESEDIGKLCTLIQQEVGITLEPPSTAEAADMVIEKAKKSMQKVEA